MKVFVVVICALLMSVAFVSADISDNCLQCICQVEGCEKEVGRCVMDQGSLSCGPYQIKNPYWIDCGEPGGDWQTCTKQFACSETCVRAYTLATGPTAPATPTRRARSTLGSTTEARAAARKAPPSATGTKWTPAATAKAVAEQDASRGLIAAIQDYTNNELALNVPNDVLFPLLLPITIMSQLK